MLVFPSILSKKRLHLPKRLKRRIFGTTNLISAEFKRLATIRSGNKISRLARLILEKVNIKTVLGGNIALFVVATGLISPTESILSSQEPETLILPQVQNKLATEFKIRFPTEKPELNQKFSVFHPGIDLHGSLGDPVHPIMNGRVESREFSKYGYGNSVIVDHQNGFKSRYAHLSKIEVEDGKSVKPNTEIGKVGSTGRSTGPHLHLEVYQNDRTINPLSVLGPTSVQSSTSIGGK